MKEFGNNDIGVHIDNFAISSDAKNELKKSKFIQKATIPTQAFLRCATCPEAGDEPFYATRAKDCIGKVDSTVFPIAQKLYEKGALENKHQEDIDPHEEGRPPRMFYDINPKVKEILKDEPPLKGCIYKNDTME